jgi:two-component system, chemotaxis family, response regulator Rcp1
MNDHCRRLRLLLVEDNPGDAFLIKEVLRDTGIDLRVTVAEDGQKALEILDRTRGDLENRIDFVILDLNLPKVDGFEVLSYIKSMHGLKELPVVVMTGSVNADDRVRAISMGASQFLKKPSSNREFEAIVEWMREALTNPEMTAIHNCPPLVREHDKCLKDKKGLDRESLPPSGSDPPQIYDREPHMGIRLGRYDGPAEKPSETASFNPSVMNP